MNFSSLKKQNSSVAAKKKKTNYKTLQRLQPISFTKDINMASNGYQYKCRQTRAHTPNHMHTHTNTWSQLTGAKDIAVGSQVLARYHVQIHTHTHTKIQISHC